MATRVKDALVTVGLGLLLAGPLAAIALAALPAAWREPRIPVAAAVFCVGIVALLRHRRRPRAADGHERDGGRPPA